MKRGNCFPRSWRSKGKESKQEEGPGRLPTCSQGWGACRGPEPRAQSTEHQKELASPSLEKPSMHVARPLISPVTDASPESPWSTDNKTCVLRKMTNEGHRGEDQSRKEDATRRPRGQKAVVNSKGWPTREERNLRLSQSGVGNLPSTLNGQVAIATAKE